MKPLSQQPRFWLRIGSDCCEFFLHSTNIHSESVAQTLQWVLVQKVPSLALMAPTVKCAYSVAGSNPLCAAWQMIRRGLGSGRRERGSLGVWWLISVVHLPGSRIDSNSKPLATPVRDFLNHVVWSGKTQPKCGRHLQEELRWKDWKGGSFAFYLLVFTLTDKSIYPAPAAFLCY